MAQFEKRKKRLILRTVEDNEPQGDPVIRLGAEKQREEDMPAVRLGPMRPPPQTVSGPAVATSEFRTHQPGIEALIEITDTPVDTEEAENDWGARRVSNRPVPWGWFVLLGGLFTSAVVWSTWSVKQAERAAELASQQVPRAVVKEQDEQREARELVERIESAVRSYFAASSVDSRLRWVRHRTRVEPLMRAHQQRYPEESRQLLSVRMQPLTIGSLESFWAVSVAQADGRQKRFIVETTADGPKIDWETLVCHQPMPWDDFARERPQGQSLDFRVYLSRDSFHSHEFADESVWACYRLTALDSQHALFGYARKDSQTQAALAALTVGTGKSSAILRLQVPVGIQCPTGVVIESMLSERWLYLNPPGQP